MAVPEVILADHSAIRIGNLAKRWASLCSRERNELTATIRSARLCPLT